MALSRVTYNVSGHTYAVPYEFLSRSHLEVYVDTTLKTIITDYTIASGGASVTFKVAGVATEPVGTTVTLKRVTPTEPFVDFSDASRVTEANLDNTIKQACFLVEEMQDDNDALEDVDDDLQDAIDDVAADLAAAVIAAGNVPTPVNPTDDGKALVASAGLYSWQTVATTLASLTDITSFGLAIGKASSQGELLKIIGAQPRGSFSRMGHVHPTTDIVGLSSGSFNPIANQVFGG